MARISFFVPGIVQTKGSVRAFTPKGWTRPILTNDNPKAKSWQGTIALAARTAGCRPTDGAVALEVVFCFQRPKSHHGKRGLLPSAPACHAQRPDVDKALRVVLDALTGIAYRDDSQVYDVRARKEWRAEPGVMVYVETAEGTP